MQESVALGLVSCHACVNMWDDGVYNPGKGSFSDTAQRYTLNSARQNTTYCPSRNSSFRTCVCLKRCGNLVEYNPNLGRTDMA